MAVLKVLINFFDHEGVLLENLWTGVGSGARLIGVRCKVYSVRGDPSEGSLLLSIVPCSEPLIPKKLFFLILRMCYIETNTCKKFELTSVIPRKK